MNEPTTDEASLRAYYRGLRWAYMHQLKVGDLFGLVKYSPRIYQMLENDSRGHWRYCEVIDGKRGRIYTEPLFYVLVHPVKGAN